VIGRIVLAPQSTDLPPLTWNDCWEGEIVLASWAGFQTRRGPYAAISSPGQSDGSARLIFDTDGAGNVPPTAAQIQAYRWLLDHEDEVSAVVLDTIFTEYPRFRSEYLDAFEEGDEEAEATAPAITQPTQLRALMGLNAVFILPMCRDGVGYVGFEFGCDWEPEHGLGVLTHMNRVVEIGQADVAFNSNRAEDDADE